MNKTWKVLFEEILQNKDKERKHDLPKVGDRILLPLVDNSGSTDLVLFDEINRVDPLLCEAMRELLFSANFPAARDLVLNPLVVVAAAEPESYKSDVVREMCEKDGLPIKVIHMSEVDPEDLLGFPMTVEEDENPICTFSSDDEIVWNEKKAGHLTPEQRKMIETHERMHQVYARTSQPKQLLNVTEFKSHEHAMDWLFQPIDDSVENRVPLAGVDTKTLSCKEAPCSTCSRPNDLNVKSCWWCETPNPTARR
jgi:hypothetical protein